MCRTPIFFTFLTPFFSCKERHKDFSNILPLIVCSGWASVTGSWLAVIVEKSWIYAAHSERKNRFWSRERGDMKVKKKVVFSHV